MLDLDQIKKSLARQSNNLAYKTSLGLAVSVFFEQLASLCDRKQQDYGSANLTDFGSNGVLVRANDKMSRLKNLYKQRVTSPTSDAPRNEPIIDSWTDLCNYAAIGYLMEAGIWPPADDRRGKLAIDLGKLDVEGQESAGGELAPTLDSCNTTTGAKWITTTGLVISSGTIACEKCSSPLVRSEGKCNRVFFHCVACQHKWNVELAQ